METTTSPACAQCGQTEDAAVHDAESTGYDHPFAFPVGEPIVELPTARPGNVQLPPAVPTFAVELTVDVAYQDRSLTYRARLEAPPLEGTPSEVEIGKALEAMRIVTARALDDALIRHREVDGGGRP